MSSDEKKAAMDARSRRQFEIDLSRLLTGNLSVSADDPFTDPRAALLHVAAAQCKAILLATANEDINVSNTGGARGWASDHKFTKADLQAALGGLTSLLECGRHVLEYMLLENMFRDSWHRTENDNAGTEAAE